MDGKNVHTEHQYSNCYLITSFVIILHERKGYGGTQCWLAGWLFRTKDAQTLPAGRARKIPGAWRKMQQNKSLFYKTNHIPLQ